MMELWPFTNFHDLNLDWIIKKIRNVEDSEAAAKASEEAAADYADDAKSYMQDAKSAKTQAAIFATQAGNKADDAAASAASIANVADQVAINTGRIDNIVANAGDGTIPSELVDARTEFTGYTNTTAGSAIRAADNIISLYTNGINGVEEVTYTTTPGSLSYSGDVQTPGATTNEVTTSEISVLPGQSVMLVYECASGNAFYSHAGYYSDTTWILRADKGSQNAQLVKDEVRDGRRQSYVIYSFPFGDEGFNTMKIVYRTYDGNYSARIFKINNAQLYKYPNLPALLPGTVGNPRHININKTTHTIFIPGDTTMLMYTVSPGCAPARSTKAGVTMSPSNVDLTASYAALYGVTSVGALLYDPTNKTIEVCKWADPKTMSDDYIMIAYFRIGPNINSDFFNIVINAPYDINDAPYGVESVNEPWRFNTIVRSINHRGYSVTAPENTLPAFKLSKKMGFDYVESDVQFTSDNVPVMLHDATINRTARNADGTVIGTTINISDITYAQALTYDFGIWKGSTYAGTKIPTLEEFLTCCRDNALTARIELKTDNPYTATQLGIIADTIRRCGMNDKFEFTSFGPTMLSDIRPLYPGCRCIRNVGEATTAHVDDCVTRGFECIACQSAADSVVDYAAENSIELELWTLDTISDIVSIDPYITGVTSNSLVAAKVLYEYSQNH